MTHARAKQQVGLLLLELPAQLNHKQSSCYVQKQKQTPFTSPFWRCVFISFWLLGRFGFSPRPGFTLFCVKDTPVARVRRRLEWDSEDLDDSLCDLKKTLRLWAIKGKNLETRTFSNSFSLSQLSTWTQRSSEILALCFIYEVANNITSSCQCHVLIGSYFTGEYSICYNYSKHYNYRGSYHHIPS